jgi:hypothetical protein
MRRGGSERPQGFADSDPSRIRVNLRYSAMAESDALDFENAETRMKEPPAMARATNALVQE